MCPIKKLTQQMIAKIAAGEVVESPSSVVKELVENAIDAQASSITVEIERAGRRLIRVTDNGTGIPSEELGMALERHATSKLQQEKDLFEIRSLGFRGEALASIAAVSEIELHSRTEEASAGASALCRHGGPIELSPVGAPRGTTVFVRDLFAKVPARLKFLKSDASESNRVLETVNRLAAARSDISFRLVIDHRHLYTTPGNKDLKQTVHALFGGRTAGTLKSFEQAGETWRVHGLISSLQNHHSNRSMQFFYVNGRWVNSAFLTRQLNGPFTHLLPKRRYPVAFVFLQGPPGSVDVNISPHKTEIKFKDEPAIAGLLEAGLDALLKTRSWSPEAVLPDQKGSSVVQSSPKPPLSHSPALSGAGRHQEIRDSAAAWPEGQPSAAETGQVPMELLSKVLNKTEERLKDISKAPFQEEGDEDLRSPGYFQSLRPLGQVFDSFIVCEDGGARELVLVDQHAAHEKVLFEKFSKAMQEKSLVGQRLMAPEIWDIPETEKARVSPFISRLGLLGFEIEAFGPGSLLVRSIPAMFSLGEGLAFLEEMKELILQGAAPGKGHSERFLDLLSLKACKAAVKARDHLEPVEIKRLLSEMDSLDNPYTCPHGRPTVIRIGVRDLEKYFKR